MKKVFSTFLALVLLVSGMVFPAVANTTASTMPECVTDSITSVTFTVGTDDEAPYLYGNAAKFNGSTARFADGEDWFCYAYPASNVLNAEKITWTARTGGQLLLEVSTDAEHWTEIYRFDGANDAVRPNTIDEWDITSAIQSTANKDTDTIYVRISDAYSSNGTGGKVLNTANGESFPVTLTVSVPAVRDSIAFTVGTDGELPYIYGSAAKWNSTHRLIEYDAQQCYVYPVKNIQNAYKITWSARTGGQLHLEVSTDGQSWTDIYRFNGGESASLSSTWEERDITSAILSTATAQTDMIYVRISDAYPQNGNGAKIINSHPVTLTVDYGIDYTAQTALGRIRTAEYSFTPTDSSVPKSGVSKVLNTLTDQDGSTEYPYLYYINGYENKARLAANGSYYYFDENGIAIYAFDLADGAVPTDMTFKAKMGMCLGIWITFDDPKSADAVWESVKVTTPDEEDGWTTTTQLANISRTLDLMPAYEKLVAANTRDSGENTLYLKIGHADTSGTAGFGARIYKDTTAKFSYTYAWYPEMESDALGFYSASLKLTNDFGIRYTINAPASYENVTLMAGLADMKTCVVEPTVNGTTMTYTFDHIPAQRLGDEVVTTLIADYDGMPVIAHRTYSVRQYCINKLNDPATSPALRTLVSDVLCYGAAAQRYSGYQTDAPVTDGVTNLSPSTFTSYLVQGERGVSGEASAVADWTSATLELDTAMTVHMYFTAADVSGLSVGITMGAVKELRVTEFLPVGNKYEIAVEVMASQFADTLTAKFYNANDEHIGRTLTYSVNGYINNAYPTATGSYKALLEAIANYGLSVNAYVEENVIASPNTDYVSQQEYNRAVAYNGATTNLTLVQNVMNKAEAGEPITVATIGGSITQGYWSDNDSANWGTYSYSAIFRDWWETTFPETQVTLVNAGIGSTTSHLGVHRLCEDVLSRNPDVCIVEFAVNDSDEPLYEVTYESLVTTLLDQGVAVILQFMVKEDGTSVQENYVAVGQKYQLPMISYGDAIYPTITSGQRTWADISPDNIHPSAYGHAYMGELLWKFLNSVYAHTPNEVEVVSYDSATLRAAAPYYNAMMLGITDVTPTQFGMFEANDAYQYSNLNPIKTAWVATPDQASEGEMSFTLTFSKLGVLYTRANDASYGICEVYVDEQKVCELNGYSSVRIPASAQVFADDEAKEHTVTFKMQDPSKTFALIRLLVTDYAQDSQQ